MNSTRIYIPPDDGILDHFACEVCDHLGGEYAGPEVKHGLAGFLKVIAQAYANTLNHKESSFELDTGIE